MPIRGLAVAALACALFISPVAAQEARPTPPHNIILFIPILKLKLPAKGHLIGRAIDEALPGGAMPQVKTGSLSSPPAANGLRTALDWQEVGSTRYFDAAGFPDRTVGLDTATPSR
jgi:hypothetical protein